MKILKKEFCLYLKTKNVSLVTQKNYLSDLGHFLNWFIFFLKSKNVDVDENNLSTSTLCSFITKEVITQYKGFLSLNHISQKTANRRLSTLRKFCSFCISQGWLKENPAKKIANIGYPKDQNEEILKKFKLSLNRENISKITVKNYLSDIKQFLIWAEGVN